MAQSNTSPATPAENKLTQLKALQALAQRVNQSFARKTDVPAKVSQLANDAKYQTDVEVAAAVAAAGHITKRIVSSTADIDTAASGADKIIYMVQKTGGSGNDLYDEYMVIDGKVEKIGNTSVNLEGYVQKENGKGLSSNDFTDAEKAKLAGFEIAADEEVAAALAEIYGE